MVITTAFTQTAKSVVRYRSLCFWRLVMQRVSAQYNRSIYGNLLTVDGIYNFALTCWL